MNEIVILGQFDLHPEDAEQAAKLMRLMMNATAEESGCIHYAYSRDLDVANRFQLSERWENGEALSGHFQTEHMAAYRGGMSQLRVLKRSVIRYDVTNSEPL